MCLSSLGLGFYTGIPLALQWGPLKRSQEKEKRKTKKQKKVEQGNLVFENI